MAEKNALQPAVGRAVSDPVCEQQQQARAVVIDAEYSEVKPDAGQAAQAAAKPKAPKFGEGHLAAMARLGLKELAQALPAFPDSTIKPVEEPGAAGNVTPQIVTDQMGYDSVLMDAAHRAQFQSQDQDRGMSR